jgi:hypothetical protein
MELDFLFKWKSSGGGGCPAVYETSAGSFVIQGYQLDAAAHGKMRNVAANETGVEIPAELFDQIGEEWARRRGLEP